MGLVGQGTGATEKNNEYARHDTKVVKAQWRIRRGYDTLNPPWKAALDACSTASAPPPPIQEYTVDNNTQSGADRYECDGPLETDEDKESPHKERKVKRQVTTSQSIIQQVSCVTLFC